jgi:hypothetical protein
MSVKVNKSKLYAKTAYEKVKEQKYLCVYCNVNVLNVKKKDHEKTTKHINNVKNGKFDFNKSITTLMNEWLKEGNKAKLLELHGLIQKEYFDKDGYEIQEEIVYDEPLTKTDEEKEFCSQAVCGMVLDLREKNDNATYIATEMIKIDNEIDELIKEEYPSIKVKLLEVFRKINNLPEILKKKEIEARDKELRDLEHKNLLVKQDYKPDKKIIKEIKNDYTFFETIDEDDEFNYTVNSNDEECYSDEDSYDIDEQIYQDALTFYNQYDSRTRIELLKQELNGCEDFDEYHSTKSQLEAKNSSQLLNKEDIKNIYFNVKKYKKMLISCF